MVNKHMIRWMISLVKIEMQIKNAKRCPCPYICIYIHLCVKVAQSFTLFNPMDYSFPGSSVHGILQARILDSCSLLQGVFLTQGLNSGRPHCRWILYHLSHQGSPQSHGASFLKSTVLQFLIHYIENFLYKHLC